VTDLYCERLGPGLWAEPLNATTNLAFFLAAWAAWILGRRAYALSLGARLLVTLIIAIGVGSTLFHTFATPWARTLDTGSILLFQISYLWLYGRRIANLSPGLTAGLLSLFVAANYAGRQFPHVFNGSLIYAPAVVVIVGLGVYHVRTHTAGRRSLLAAATVFLLAVIFRVMDRAVCPVFPFGTHFLWHLLIPVVLYFLMRGLLLNTAHASGGRATFRSSEEFLRAVSDLIARLEAAGHVGAAAELRDGFRSINGLTDGAARFLASVDRVRSGAAARFAPEDQEALAAIRSASHRAVYGPRG
jgi:hypothetical protein